MRIWMAKDPETHRVLVQDREFADGDFPPGLRGLDWPRRELEVDQQVFDSLLAGAILPNDQDVLHRDWWTDAAGEGGAPWPA